MIGQQNFTQTEQGWTLPMTPEMTSAAGVPEGSLVVLHFHTGNVEAEIFPPPTPGMKQEVCEIAEKFHDLFVELKRRGD